MARRFGLPEVGPVAGDEDDRSGRSRTGGSMHSDYGRTALSVTGQVHFDFQVPDNRRSDRVGGVILVDFARPASR